MTRPGNKSPHPEYATHPLVAKWCIWSVANQIWLAGQIRIYLGAATAVLAFFALTGFLSLQTALTTMFFSGMIIAVTLWLLIRQRRFWLLHIRQPELRRQALAAMVNYLNAINYPLPMHVQRHTIQESDPNEGADYSHSR
jgi:hypothetical protein